MKYEVVWTWAAEVDAQEAFKRLDERDPALALRFVETTDGLLSLLQSFPRLASAWRPPVRRALIRRSHYGLFYVVEPSRLVVIALKDLRQDPEKLKENILDRLP